MANDKNEELIISLLQEANKSLVEIIKLLRFIVGEKKNDKQR